MKSFSSQVAGGCWYVLAVQRVGACLRHECELKNNCDRIPLIQRTGKSFCGRNLTASYTECLKPEGPFPYGIYSWALPAVSSDSVAVKILFPLYWGLITIRSYRKKPFIFLGKKKKSSFRPFNGVLLNLQHLGQRSRSN